MHLSSPSLPSPLPSQRVGAGGVGAFQRLLASILETLSFFPVPAPFMQETMRTYSECLVYHLGPRALWQGDFVQWVTPSPPSLRSPHTQSRGLQPRLFQPDPGRITCRIFPRGSREILVMWFQGNNSDDSRIYPWIPAGLFTHVSSSPFVSLFLPSTPLPTSPQESCTFPLSSACFALASPQGGKGCFPLQMRSGLHPKCGLAFFACCVLLQRHKHSQRIWRNLPSQCPSAPLWHAVSDTEPISGWRYKPVPEFAAQGLCRTVMPQEVAGLVHVTRDLGSGLFVRLKDSFPVAPRHITSNGNDIYYISSTEVSHRKICDVFLWSLPLLENCFKQEPFYRIPWRSPMNLTQNTSLCSKLHSVIISASPS